MEKVIIEKAVKDASPNKSAGYTVPASLFYGAKIPSKKLDNAQKSYAPDAASETVIALADTTIFGSAKEGLLITDKHIYSSFLRMTIGLKRFGGLHDGLPYEGLIGVTLKDQSHFLAVYEEGKALDVYVSIYAGWICKILNSITSESRVSSSIKSERTGNSGKITTSSPEGGFAAAQTAPVLQTAPASNPVLQVQKTVQNAKPADSSPVSQKSAPKFVPSKPVQNIVVLGNHGHGKTTLVCALAAVLRDRGYANNPVLTCDELDRVPSERIKRVSSKMAKVSLESARYNYSIADFPTYMDAASVLVSGDVAADAALVVIDQDSYANMELESLLKIASAARIKDIILFLNKVDNIDDDDEIFDEAIEYAQSTALEKIEAESLSCDAVIYGSASEALTCPDGPYSGPIMDLVDALESLPEPEESSELPFLMAVDNSFTITERGNMANGRVERGCLHVGDGLELVGYKDWNTDTAATGIDMFRKMLDYAETGDNISVLLRNVQRDDIVRGMVLSEPGYMHAHTSCNVLIQAWRTEEGGANEKIANNEQLQFFFRNTDFKGRILLAHDFPYLRPGEFNDAVLDLAVPVPMEPGDRFFIRKGPLTLGAGIVSYIPR